MEALFVGVMVITLRSELKPLLTGIGLIGTQGGIKHFRGSTLVADLVATAYFNSR